MFLLGLVAGFPHLQKLNLWLDSPVNARVPDGPNPPERRSKTPALESSIREEISFSIC